MSSHNPHRVKVICEPIFPHDPEAQERWRADYGYVLEWWAECKFCGWHEGWLSSHKEIMTDAYQHYLKHEHKPCELEEKMIADLGLRVRFEKNSSIWRYGYSIILECDECNPNMRFSYGPNQYGAGDKTLEQTIQGMQGMALEHLREFHIGKGKDND